MEDPNDEDTRGFGLRGSTLLVSLESCPKILTLRSKTDGRTYKGVVNQNSDHGTVGEGGGDLTDQDRDPDNF